MYPLVEYNQTIICQNDYKEIIPLGASNRWAEGTTLDLSSPVCALIKKKREKIIRQIENIY